MKVSFKNALAFVKHGRKAWRSGWNGSGQYIALQEGSTIDAQYARGGVAKRMADDGFEKITIRDHIDFKNAQGEIMCGWVPTASDMFAEDWETDGESLGEILHVPEDDEEESLEFSFTDALVLFETDRAASRKNWNGNGMSVRKQTPTELSKMTLPYLYLTLPNGNTVPWNPSVSDLLAYDWYEVE